MELEERACVLDEELELDELDELELDDELDEELELLDEELEELEDELEEELDEEELIVTQ